MFWTNNRQENTGEFERRVSLLFVQYCKFNMNMDMAKWLKQNTWQIEKIDWEGSCQ